MGTGTSRQFVVWSIAGPGPPNCVADHKTTTCASSFRPSHKSVVDCLQPADVLGYYVSVGRRGRAVFRRVGLILALMMTSAAADDYRSYREAYAAVDWPNSITSAEQCQRRVDDVVRQFGFTDPEARMSRWTGDPALWVKDKVHHFDIVFSCGPGKRILNINIDSWEGQTASAGDLLDTLINSFAAP